MDSKKDMNELLPFCMRCFGIGISADEKTNFCHQCGSEQTCVSMARKDIYYLQENINNSISNAKKYTQEFCKKDTIEHINTVKEYIIKCAGEILIRANEHDKSKLDSPEIEIFTEFTPKLKHSTYGSDEYKSYLKEMGKALEHHYKNNRHHPENHSNGINDMNLIDLIEMMCDWIAATKRHDDGDIIKSIDINSKRFNIDGQLESILKNTVEFLNKDS